MALRSSSLYKLNSRTASISLLSIAEVETVLLCSLKPGPRDLDL